MTSVSFSFNQLYDVFFSICLGLFVGGILLSIISTFLAQMESNISGEGDLDVELDVDGDVDVDIDTDVDIDIDTDIDIDSDVDIDIDAEVDVDIDYDMGAEIEVDAVEVDAGVEVDSDIDVDVETESEFDANLSDITPAPIMLLLSTVFLVFGISGIILYYSIIETLRFVILFLTPLFSYITSKFINYGWKKLAKSRYYSISSTMNLIGKKGEIILPVDRRGGIIKIPSTTPMKFERLHVKPLVEGSEFDRGDSVYICDVKNGYLLVDNNKKLIKSKRW
ncbi:MAG: hypothetical protein ACFE8L_03550 [Candidatus Hodarchaeota archaeon]